jgi:GNAT superfamily N-acetyltransferase
MTEIAVRRAAEPDFEVVAALLGELGRTPISDETRSSFRFEYLRQLHDPSCVHLVAESDGEVVGFCVMHLRRRLSRVTPEAWIPDLIVTEAARGTGAGGALMVRAIETAREWNCHRVCLESGHPRSRAHEFYRGGGMKEAGYYYSLEL